MADTNSAIGGRLAVAPVEESPRQRVIGPLLRYRWLLLFFIVLALLAWLIWQTAQQGNLGIAERSLWDWLELLVVPAALVSLGVWLGITGRQVARETSARGRESDRQIAFEGLRQSTLDHYFDAIFALMVEKNLGPDTEAAIKRLARGRTIAALRELRSERNEIVIQFLQEVELLAEDVITLKGAHLVGVELNGALLHGARLERVNLKKAALVRANLTWANLNEAVLYMADLEAADLKGASLVRANLEWANLKGANFELASLREANLKEATLEGANMKSAGLSRAHLEGAVLIGADLSEATLVGANLTRADLTRANLEQASLLEANLTRANLAGANLRKARVSLGQLHKAILTDDTILPNGATYKVWKSKMARPLEAGTNN